MRCCLLLLSCASLTLSAQVRVNEVCSSEHIRHDSSMYHKYGHFFFDYIRFDSATAYTRVYPEHLYYWLDSAEVDSIRKFEFTYYFQYPGALRGNAMKPKQDAFGCLVVDTTRYRRSGKLIDTSAMSRITQKQFGQPLSACSVELWDFNSYRTDDETYRLDSTHTYLMLKYRTSRRRYGFGQPRALRIVTRSILIDGCTGEIIRPLHKRISYQTPGKF